MRVVPSRLQEHLDERATTTTRLLKITTKTGQTFGLAMCDRDITYDDGGGEITYVAMNGFDATTFAADTGYSVANAESYALISDEVEGIEVEDVEAGLLDDAQWVCYLVNFEDLTMDHVILDAGDVGEVKTRYGMVWIPELLSHIMRLKQPVGSVWSRTCRAIFGTPAHSQTGCGVSITNLWVNGTVQSVGDESNRVFVGDEVTNSPSPSPFPGRVQFLTGANAGKEFATEEVNGETVTLSETTPYPIEAGDTYRIRPDCRKRYLEDCIQTWDNGPNFKGEPTIPTGEVVSAQTPGADLGRGGRNS